MAQIEAVDLEAVTPVGEVGLLRVARGRVAGKTRRDDQVGARAQQLDPRLVADLDAPARQERDAALEVGGLGALREVERRARRAQLVVEGMQLAVRLLADVAVLLLDVARARASTSGSKASRGYTFGVVNTGLSRSTRMPVSASIDSSARDARVALLLALRLREPAPLDDVRVEDVGRRREQPRALLDRQRAEQAAVVRDRLEQLGRRAQRSAASSVRGSATVCSPVDIARQGIWRQRAGR